MSSTPSNINIRQLFFRIKAAINASKAGYGGTYLTFIWTIRGSASA